MSQKVPGTDKDEKLLQQMGYKQELARRMSGFSNFAISFSIICILAGASPPSRWALARRAAARSGWAGCWAACSP
ncbi:MAG: hypothetical protein SFU83_18145 [Meiothermus sp.]|nr:hypothetical protein [Meiothermus sp.]